MSEKNLDPKGRLRSRTVGFRVSPEEGEELDRRVKLSGLTKQDYIIKKLTDKQVTVIPNSRIHWALRDVIRSLIAKLEKTTPFENLDEELQDAIKITIDTYNALYNDNKNT